MQRDANGSNSANHQLVFVCASFTLSMDPSSKKCLLGMINLESRIEARGVKIEDCTDSKAPKKIQLGPAQKTFELF